MAGEIVSQDGGGAPPGLLYHYTDEKGLFGILDSSEIWPTHVRFLNDVSEQQEGPHLFEQELHSFFGESAKSLVLGNSDSLRLALAQSYIRSNSREVDTFVMSFTEDAESENPGDRLSQWRGYGPGTSGVCLGFDRNNLDSQANTWAAKHRVTLSIEKCLYHQADKIIRARGLVHELKPLLLDETSNNSRWIPPYEEIVEMQRNLNPNLEWMSDYMTWVATCKHAGFVEEDESRIVVRLGRQHSALVFFRNGKFTSVPHLKIPMKFTGDDGPLREIIVGPSHDKEQSVVRLRINLAQRQIAKVEVRPSRLPYRSW